MKHSEQFSTRSGSELRQKSGKPTKSGETRFAVLESEGPGDSLRDRFISVERAKREWEMAVDALPELICVVDDQGYLVRANFTVERWSLGSVISVAGQPFHRFIHQDCDAPCYLTSFLDRAMKHTRVGQPVEQEVYDAILRRHVQIRALPIHGGDRKAGCNLAIIMHDITSRKEMESALQQNNDRLKVLNAVSSAILSAQSPEEIAQIVLRHIETLVPFQQAYIMLKEPAEDQFVILASANMRQNDLGTNSSLPFTALGDKIDKYTNELFLIADLHYPDRLTQFEEQMRDQGTGSYINVPLRGEALSLGMFIVGMDSIDTFKAGQIQVIREVSEMLTVAIRQAQLYQKYRRTDGEVQYLRHLRDQLTGNDARQRFSPLSLIQDHPELMNDEFFSSLIDDSVDFSGIRDNWDDLLG